MKKQEKKNNPNMVIIEDRVQGGSLDKPFSHECVDLSFYSMGMDKRPCALGGGFVNIRNKHNELMQMYKAYKILFSKAMKYKEELSEFRALNIKSSISRPKLNKMLDEQKYIMKHYLQMQK